MLNLLGVLGTIAVLWTTGSVALGLIVGPWLAAVSQKGYDK